MDGSIGTLLVAIGGIYIIYRAIYIKRNGKVEEKDTPIASKISDMAGFVNWYSKIMLIMGGVTLLFAILFAVSDFGFKGAWNFYLVGGLVVFIVAMSIVSNKGTRKYVHPDDFQEYKEEKRKKNKPEGK